MAKAHVIASGLHLAADCVSDARTLLKARSRNAAYLASEAAEHVVRVIATSEDLHIERRDAHQLDTVVRRLPDENSMKADLASITFLEAYSTSYRYPTPAGRLPKSPPDAALQDALDKIESLLARLKRHFIIDEAVDAPAGNPKPPR